MLKLRIASDIHTECIPYPDIEDYINLALPPLKDDKNTILILAGDIGSIESLDKLEQAIGYLSPRFRTILYVGGNHEAWGGDLQDYVVTIHDRIKQFTNVIFDNFEQIPFSMLGDPRPNSVWLATLWTDFKDNPLYMNEAKLGMPDYTGRILSYDKKRKATPDDTANIHRLTMNLLKDVQAGDIIVSHHLPSYKSVAHKYMGSPLNPAFASDLDEFILEKEPMLWVHGHTHTTRNYYLGRTHVVCNPHGYAGYDVNPLYSPAMVIEV